MKILEILETPEIELYPEDFAFFEVELDTGDYTEEYRESCRQKMATLRQSTEPVPTTETILPEAKPAVSKAVPKPTVAPENPEKFSGTILDEIEHLRQEKTYRSDFNKYLTKTKQINAEFVDVNFNFLTYWEINTILRRRKLGEDFLEKHFYALNRTTISRYQTFSESFFMRHYDQLDCKLVLQAGKNPWKDPDKRSRQLDVFLRLRGVKI